MVGGTVPSDGLVEIWYNSTWRAVCNSPFVDWGIIESNVVCRQLGYQGALTQTRTDNYVQGDPFILPVQWSCRGYELTILECLTSDTSIECFGAGVACMDITGKLFVNYVKASEDSSHTKGYNVNIHNAY